MKKLKYIWKHRTGDDIKVHFPPSDASGKEVEHKPEFTATFNPFAEMPEKYAERILTNPRYAGWFEEVSTTVDEPPAEFICDECGKAVKSKAALGAHKRIHKKA